MGTLKLSNSSGNFIALDAPSSISTDKTFTLPNADGSSGQVIQTNGSGVLSFVNQTTDTTGWTWDTSGTSLSGSSVSITGIPSTATQIIVAVRDMSLGSNANVILRAGISSGLASTGYVANGFYIGASNANDTSTFTNGWSMWGAAAASYGMNGVYTLTNLTGDVWDCNGNFSREAVSTNTWGVQGHVELSGTLDRVGLVPTSGSFDGGSVFVHYFSP